MKNTADRYTRLGYEPYRWFHADGAPPFAPLAKPLSRTRLGMLCTSGAYAVGQVAYHYKDDSSLRAIPSCTPDASLRFAHVTENFLVDARRDPQCLVPTAALRRLEEEGVIGGLADTFYSCMGGVYSQRRVREQLSPALLEAFRAQKVDAVLLVPMCPICHQSACILSRHLEAHGIPTMCLGSAHDILTAGRPPRATFVDYPLGHSAGKAFDRADQYAVVRAAILGFTTMTQPGQLAVLPNRWAESDDWKQLDAAPDRGDTRQPRDETPRFQLPADRDAAVASGALAA
jgi:D-proline reductase (dithiol) PrdB